MGTLGPMAYGRGVAILDLEVGLGWTSPGRMLRSSVGYMFSGWYDVVMMDEFIDSVRANNSVDASDSLGFDGLVLRGEFRF